MLRSAVCATTQSEDNVEDQKRAGGLSRFLSLVQTQIPNMARAAAPPYRLQFNLPLKGCTHAELLKRLRGLHVELSQIDQEGIVVESLGWS